MTPRQRVETVLRGGRADQVPLTMYSTMVPQCEAERRLRNDGLCIVYRMSVVKEHQPNVKIETHTYSEDGVSYVRRTYTTPVGQVDTVSRPSELGFTSWTVSKTFKRPEDYKVLTFMANDTQYEADYEPLVKRQRWMGEDVVLRAGLAVTPLHEIMIHTMGVETFAVEWFDRRDEVEKLYTAMTEQRRRTYALVAQSPALHTNYGGNETGDVMGRERFEQYVLPHWVEAAEVLHKHGTLIGSHLDGNNKVWADLVADSPLDYIEAFTPAPDSDMSLEDALAAWPGKVLWINFPSSVHLRTDEGVAAATRQLLAESAPGDRLIVGITENIPEHRWQNSMQAISDVLCTDGRLPIGA